MARRLKRQSTMNASGPTPRAAGGSVSHGSAATARSRAAVTIAIAAAALVLMSSAGGCASGIPRYVTAPPPEASPAALGDGSQAVFHADVVREALAATPRQDAPELSRNAGILAQREPTTAYDAAAWPTPPTPTLAGLRRITLTESRRSTTVYLFREQRSTTWYGVWPRSSGEYRPWPR